MGLPSCWDAHSKLHGALYALDWECGGQPVLFQLVGLCVLA